RSVRATAVDDNNPARPLQLLECAADIGSFVKGDDQRGDIVEHFLRVLKPSESWAAARHPAPPSDRRRAYRGQRGPSKTRGPPTLGHSRPCASTPAAPSPSPYPALR